MNRSKLSQASYLKNQSKARALRVLNFLPNVVTLIGKNKGLKQPNQSGLTGHKK